MYILLITMQLLNTRLPKDAIVEYIFDCRILDKIFSCFSATENQIFKKKKLRTYLHVAFDLAGYLSC